MVEYSEFAYVALLQVIRDGKSLNALIERKYTYSQIGEMISICLTRGHVVYDEDKLLITDLGREYLNSPRLNTKEFHYKMKPLDSERLVWDDTYVSYVPSRKSVKKWIGRYDSQSSNAGNASRVPGEDETNNPG